MATHNNQRTRGHKIPTYRTDPRGILPLDSSRKALKPVKYLEISFVVLTLDFASIAGIDQPKSGGHVTCILFLLVVLKGLWNLE